MTSSSEGKDGGNQIKNDSEWTDTDIDDPPAWSNEIDSSESSDTCSDWNAYIGTLEWQI